MTNSDEQPRQSTHLGLDTSADNSSMDEAYPSADVFAGLAAAFGPEKSLPGNEKKAASLYEPGSMIADKYRLIEQIGEGGMGSVWYAEQFSPVKRKVAIKVVKPGLDSGSVLSRFEAERQALAMMDHPNIARVFDGGMTGFGQPYFVMELVRGTSITAWCDHNKISLRQRLELLVQVCQAIHHAHQKGVIHRDIKPSNVMVALFDGKPIPKVIDFGVAKAFGDNLTGESLHTAFGAVLGTAEYMSPEQAQLNNLDIDTRSDVYSLGVLIYELLAGSTPFTRAELQEHGWHEVLRVIRDVDPPLPSVRLSTSKMRASIAALRGIEPSELGKLLRSELDWIVMKSLEKDRLRRYESAAALAGDLQRYLRDEPVEACPPSTFYRLRKSARRYRWQVLAFVMILASLVAGIIGTSLGLVRAESQRKIAIQAMEAAEERATGERHAKIEAQRQQELAEAAEEATLESYRASTNDVIEQLIGSKPQLGQQERAYLNNTLKRWQEFADRKGDDERSRAIRGDAHFRVGLLWKSLGQDAEARSEMERAASIMEQLIADFPNVPDHRNSLARCLHDLGVMLAGLREQQQALNRLQRAQELKESLVAEFPSVAEYRALLARNYVSLGSFKRDLGSLREAETLYLKAMAIRQKLVEEFPVLPEMRRDLATGFFNLAILLKQQGNASQAEERYHAAISELEKLAQEFPERPSYRHQLANCQRSLALLLKDRKRLEEVEGLLQAGKATLASLAAEFPTMPDYQSDLASIHQTLGNFLSNANRQTEAEANYLAAISIEERLATLYPAVPEHRAHLAASYFNLARQMRNLDRLNESKELYRKAVWIQEELVRQFPVAPAYTHSLGTSQNGLAVLLVDMGRAAEAEVEYQKTLSILQKLVADYPAIPKYAEELSGSYCNWANFLRDAGRVQESLEWYDKAVATLRPIYDADKLASSAKGYLRNVHWGRARAQRLLGVFSESDWDFAIELTNEDRQHSFHIRKWIARYRTGDPAVASSELDAMKEWLIRVQEGSLSAMDWFDLACLLSFASTQRTEPTQKQALMDQAIEMLQRAVRAGFADVPLVQQDPSLDAIRNRDEFKESLDKISRQSKTP